MFTVTSEGNKHEEIRDEVFLVDDEAKCSGLTSSISHYECV